MNCFHWSVRSLLGLVLVASPTACFTGTDAESALPGLTQEAMVVAEGDGQTRAVIAEGLVDVPADEAFAWIADPQLAGFWLAERVEGAPGAGSMTLSWPSRGFAIHGTPRRVETPRTLAYDLQPYGAVAATELRLSVEPVDHRRSRVVIEQRPFPGGVDGDAIALRHRQAWSDAIAALRIAVIDPRQATVAAPPG